MTAAGVRREAGASAVGLQVDHVEQRARSGGTQREIALAAFARQLRGEHQERSGKVIANGRGTTECAPHHIGARQPSAV